MIGLILFDLEGTISRVSLKLHCRKANLRRMLIVRIPSLVKHKLKLTLVEATPLLISFLLIDHLTLDFANKRLRLVTQLLQLEQLKQRIVLPILLWLQHPN